MGCSHHQRCFPLASQSVHLTSGNLTVWLPWSVSAGSVRIQLSIGQWMRERGDDLKLIQLSNSSLIDPFMRLKLYILTSTTWICLSSVLWLTYHLYTSKNPILVCIALQLHLSISLYFYCSVCLSVVLYLLFNLSLLFNQILSFVHSLYLSVYLSLCLMFSVIQSFWLSVVQSFCPSVVFCCSIILSVVNSFC